jgi:hypothetical protein
MQLLFLRIGAENSGAVVRVRLRKRQQKKGHLAAPELPLRRELQIEPVFIDKSSLSN